MNAQRRKQIEELMAKAEELKAAIDELSSDEQDAYDNLPISLQDGEKGNTMQEAIDNLESAASSLEEVADYLTSAME